MCNGCIGINVDNINGNLIGVGKRVMMGSQLNNINGIIAAYGAKSLCNAEINNITNKLIVNGDQSLLNATIKGISNLEVNGTNALNNTLTIIDKSIDRFEAEISGAWMI